MTLLFVLLVAPLQVSAEMTLSVGVFGGGGEVEGTNGTVVVIAEDTTATFWCDGLGVGETPSHWDVCKWYRPNFSVSGTGSDSCMWALGQSQCPQVPSDFSSWRINKVGTRCSLIVGQLNGLDLGLWRCILSPENSDGDLENKFQEIEVERRELGEPRTVTDPGQGLEVSEGDSRKFTCNSSAIANEVPQVDWNVGGRELPGENQILLDQDQQNDTVNHWKITSTLELVVSLQQDGMIVQCTVTLTDDIGTTKAFANSLGALSVIPVPDVRTGGLETWEVVLIVVFPLILLLVIAILFLCWWLGCCCTPLKQKVNEEKDNSKIVFNGMPAPAPTSAISHIDKVPLPRRTPPSYVDLDLVSTRSPTSESSSVSSNLTMVHPWDTHGDQLTTVLPWDPYSDQPDRLVIYQHEGGHSSSYSLSSLDSNTFEEVEGMGEAFTKMGPRFSALADLYWEPDLGSSSCSSEPEWDSGGSQRQPSCDQQPFESWV